VSATVDIAGALKKSVVGIALSRDEARDVFTQALSGSADALQLAGLLASMATRGEAAEEIAGAVDALRQAMTPFEHAADDAIDTCGTGGDGTGSFNLSTAAAIVAAAAGARVIKHGNRALSSRCGSADLLEALGIPLDLSPQAGREVLERVGITFLFAPQYHPALRAAAPVRKALGVRTVFNLLGPLLNPGRVKRQLLGVGERRRVEQLAGVLRELGVQRALVVHGAGAADELTLAGDNFVEAVGSLREQRFDARALDLTSAPLEALAGGDAAYNARLLAGVLDGERGALADAVVLNAAAALVVAGRVELAPQGCELAREQLVSGAAKRKLSAWIAAARRAR
jgi:anthranilate phosphoribosyltransferase